MLASVGVLGEKGKKSQNKIETNPKHFMRNADKLTAWKGVTEESWPFWSTENSTKLFFEFEQKCRYQFYFALALLLFIADCLSNQGLRMPALGWASTKAWGCSPQKDQLSLLYLGHRDSSAAAPHVPGDPADAHGNVCGLRIHNAEEAGVKSALLLHGYSYF